MLERELMTVAQIFAKEVRRLEGLKAGTRAQITLEVRWAGWEDGAPKLKLSCYFHAPDGGGNVEAASLGQLMDEVHRRCGFADQTATAAEVNDRQLVALEGPKDQDQYDFSPA